MIHFSKATNKLIKQGLILLILILGGVISMSVIFNDSPFVTKVGYYQEQPVPFPHRTHVKELGLECVFCHTQVERSDTAGIPAMETCYGCHKEILTQSKMLEPVRESYREKKPLKWNRVNRLPDHVYFYHRSHIEAGISCTTCHGDVENMALTTKAHQLSMSWCLKCHQNIHGEDQMINGKNIRLQDCYTCHR